MVAAPTYPLATGRPAYTDAAAFPSPRNDYDVMAMRNPYLSFVRNRLIAALVGSAVALLWFAAFRAPVLSIAGDITGAEMAETGSLSIIQLIRFAAGILLFTFVPILAYLGWLRLMRPDASKVVSPGVRFTTIAAAVVSIAFFVICWLPSTSSATSVLDAFHEAAATEALPEGVFLGNTLAGAAVTTVLLVVFGLICLFLAPPPRPAADTSHPGFPTTWWSWVPLPAFMIGVLAGALPFVS